MNKSKLLASTLGLALIAGPVLAQQADAPLRRDMPMQNGAMPMPAPATTGPAAAPGAGRPMHEGHGRGRHAQDTRAQGMGEDGTHRHHGKMRAERAAARAENRMDVGELVEQAGTALRAGRTAQASNLLEQGETRLLTRSAPADRADQPMRGPVLDRISAARGAIQARDRAGAMREIEQARTMLRAEPNSGAGTMGNAPMQGGGPGMGNPDMGGRTMRDSGPAGTSMSRADNVIRVQAGGSGSGGLSGSTPGSPGVGNPGSTPSTGMGTTTQPSQGSASPGTPMGGRTGSSGVGAPPPGATAPMPGSGPGAVGGGGTIRPGSTQSGGGTGSNPGR